MVTSFAFAPNAIAADKANGKGDTYKLTIPSQSVADAVKTLSYRTQRSVLFQTDELGDTRTNTISGTYSLEEALKALLAGTNLSGDLTESGVIVISLGKRTNALSREGEVVMREQVKKTLLTGASALIIGAVQAPAIAQEGGFIEIQLHEEAVNEWGAVRGNVSDQRTGTPLVGALVRVTGRGGHTVSTDDKGNFRFAKVAAGTQLVTISYLGYHELELQDGETVDGVYTLIGVSGKFDEIVVYGSRSARARALNQERIAANSSTVISSDALGDFVGTSLSEALRRAPGVTFQQDPRTGAGTNIMVRGLSPALNAVKLNGLNLASTNAGGNASRSANLSNILADSIEKVTIHKTLLPSHDSAGTGGLVEVETKSPLSRPSKYFNVTLERGQRASDFSSDFLASGTASRKFGASERFGVSASVQFRKTDNTNIRLEKEIGYGSYLPLEADGSLNIFTQQEVDPRQAFPFSGGDDKVYVVGSSNSFDRTEEDTLAVTLSAEWLVTDNTEWKVDLQRSATNRDSISGSSSFNAPLFGEVLPIASLGGELRVASLYDGTGRAQITYRESLDVEDINNTYSFRGVTRKDAWEFNYTAGYARSNSSTPLDRSVSALSRDGVGLGFLLPEATDADEGRVVSLYGRYADGYQLPLLTEAGWNFINDPNNYDFSNLTESSDETENTIYEARGSAKYDFNKKNLKYIEFGLDYKNSNNTSSTSDQSYSPNSVVTLLLYRGLRLFLLLIPVQRNWALIFPPKTYRGLVLTGPSL